MVATGKDAVAFEGAEKLVAELEAKGLEVIYDDRKKVSPGVKFKDAELIGVPLVAVVGRDYVNDGTIELRDRNGETRSPCPPPKPPTRSPSASPPSVESHLLSLGVNRIKRHSAQSQNGALLWITETYPHS